MISMQLTQGVDISDKMLASFSVDMLGQEGSERQSGSIRPLANIDVYNYILKTLLAPDNAKIWSSAPGGYIPLPGMEMGQICFYNLLGINGDLTLSHSQVPYTDPRKIRFPFTKTQCNDQIALVPRIPVLISRCRQSPFPAGGRSVSDRPRIHYAAYPNKAMTFNQMNLLPWMLR